VSIFRRRSKKKVTLVHLPPTTLIRNIIYDSGVDSPETIAAAMGLNPLSEEVSEMEISASFDRLEKIKELLPILEAHAVICAEINAKAFSLTEVKSAYIEHDGEEEDSDDDMTTEVLYHLFKNVAISTAVSCLTSLISFNLIKNETKEVHKVK
jgi:hypothetical protein